MGNKIEKQSNCFECENLIKSNKTLITEKYDQLNKDLFDIYTIVKNNKKEIEDLNKKKERFSFFRKKK